MPPRYAYWTILVGDQPTAFRAGSQEDLMPTFKRLQAKHADAKMMWFQNGKLWPSRIDAQEAMRARGEMGRRGDDRQAGGFRDRDRRPARFQKPEWKPKTLRPQDLKTSESAKLDWKPKGEVTPAPKRSEKPDWKPRSQARSPKSRVDWKPKSQAPSPKSRVDWKPKSQAPSPKSRVDWKPKSQAPSPKSRLEWTPKAQAPSSKSPEKRKWVPKAEYKKSLGIEAKRDAKWRPGGEHRDPRQKYKDAKKAKWSKFKKNIRNRWETKPPKKKAE